VRPHTLLFRNCHARYDTSTSSGASHRGTGNHVKILLFSRLFIAHPEPPATSERPRCGVHGAWFIVQAHMCGVFLPVLSGCHSLQRIRRKVLGVRRNSWPPLFNARRIPKRDCCAVGYARCLITPRSRLPQPLGVVKLDCKSPCEALNCSSRIERTASRMEGGYGSISIDGRELDLSRNVERSVST
jgi:hypothetical protein